MLWLKQPIACSNWVLAKDWVPNWNRIFCLASKMALPGCVMRSMDYDVETGKLYYLHNSSYGGCTLYEIDTVQKTFKANGSSNGTYVGLYTGYTSAVPSSPAAPEGLTLTPAPDGSNSCVLTWTCPATTFNRQTLDKLAHATIYRDGEVIGTTENVAPGKEASYTDTDAATGIR